MYKFGLKQFPDPSLDPNAYGVPDPSLSFSPEPVEIRSSSNGLLCCQGRDGYKAYYICNPVTRKWTKHCYALPLCLWRRYAMFCTVSVGGFVILGMMDGKLCSTRSKPPTLTVQTLCNAYTNTMAMHSNVKSWVMKHRINVSAPMSSGTSGGRMFVSGNVIMFWGRRKMHIYDIRTKEFKCVCDGLVQSGRLVSQVKSCGALVGVKL